MSRLIKTILTPCLLLTAYCLLLTPSALAQANTATLTGTLQDENAAVIPGVDIEVRNIATSTVRHATTNESGFFTVPLLQPGTYSVTARRDGFTTVRVPEVILNVGDQKAMTIQLKVGTVSTEVIVHDNPSLVRTDGSVGTVIDQQFVRNAPLNGRSFQTLLALTPGIVFSGTNNGEFNVNGQRANANYFTVDGADANTSSAVIVTVGGSPLPGLGAAGALPGLTASGTTASMVAVDALQEFRVQTSSYAPEFGRMPGGQVQLVTKSGTNDVHGSVFDYVRNEAFDANDWFANRAGQPRPPTRQHQFGGTFSGPIYLPKFGEGGPKWYSGKDRTHFFFSFEGLRLQQPRFLQTSVPTPCFRGTGPCEGGRTAAHVAIQPFLQVFPLPNGPEGRAACNPATEPNPPCDPVSRTKPSGFARFAAGYSDSSRYDATSFRLDHAVGPLTFFGRYAATPSSSTTRATFSKGTATINRNTLTLGSTWTMSKKIVNDLRFNRTTINSGFLIEEVDAGRPPSFGFLGRTPDTAQFVFNLLGLPAPTTVVQSFWGRTSDFDQQQFNIVDDLLWTLGSHQLKFGLDFRRVNPDLVTKLAGVEILGLNYSQLNTGQVASYSIQTFDRTPRSVIFDNFSAYVQDTWKATSRLTMTYGLRWEFVPPPRASKGPEAITLDGLEASDIFAPGVLSLAPQGTPLWRKRYNNFAPRFGASYLLVQRPGRELVIRGGGGIFYDLGLGSSAVGYGVNSWPARGIVTYPISGSGSSCPGPFTFPLPACALVRVEPGVNNRPTSIQLVARDIVLPRVYQWNFSAEQSLGKNQTLTISYVGAAGRGLLSSADLRVRLRGYTYPGTTDTTLSLQRNVGVSDYKALQLQFQRRLSRGLQAIFAYTFSESKDTESLESLSGIPSELVTRRYSYGFSNFDVRHNLQAAVTYRIPQIKLAFFEAVTRNWDIAVRFGGRTGFPINPGVQGFVPDAPTQTFSIRANLVPGQPFWIDDPAAPGGRRLNLNAFRIPSPGTLGDLPRGSVRGFPLRQLDLSLSRDFSLMEKVRLGLRADVFNVTNTPIFVNPSGFLSSTSVPETFGAATAMLNRGVSASNGLSSLYQAGGPRSMQFSARISF